jgi:hypothetical protein
MRCYTLRKAELILRSAYHSGNFLRLVRRISETGRAAILKRGIKGEIVKPGKTCPFIVPMVVRVTVTTRTLANY